MRDLQSHVQRRFKLSVVLSIAAKLSASILQLISIPIAIKSLGIDGYATFAVLFAASLAPQVFTLRHGPVLTGPIATLYVGGRWNDISARLWSAFFASLITVVISVIAVLAFYFHGYFAAPTPSAGMDESDILKTLVALSAMHLMYPLLLVFEDAQAALHESHLQGLRIAIGNFGAIIAMAFLLRSKSSLLMYATALVLPPFAVRVANVVIFLIRYPQLRLTRGSSPVATIFKAMRTGLMFTAVAGIGSYASNQLPVIAAAMFLNSSQTASVAVIQQLTLIAFAFGSVIIVGFLPALNSSLAAGDKDWVKEWLTKIDKAFFWIGIPGVVLFVTIGEPLHNYLLKEDLAIPRESMLFAGVYAVLTIAENFYFLLASSMRLSTRASFLFVARAALTGAVAFLSCAIGYAPMIWLGASILTLCITVLEYRSMVWAYVKNFKTIELPRIPESVSLCLNDSFGPNK